MNDAAVNTLEAAVPEMQRNVAPNGAQTSSPRPPLVARKLSLRVSGARVGDAARPIAGSGAAAGSIASGSRSSRSGLRVHARGTTPPHADPRPTSCAEDDTPYAWEGQP